MTIAARLALIIDGMCRMVAARGGRDRSITPLIVLLWTRIRRAGARLEALMEKYRTGTLPAPLPPRARKARRTPNETPPDETPPPRPKIARLPGGSTWLIRLVPYHAVAYGGQLQHLLTDPDMAAFLAAAPQAWRTLRPLCRMFGVILPKSPTPPECPPPECSPPDGPPPTEPPRTRSEPTGPSGSVPVPDPAPELRPTEALKKISVPLHLVEHAQFVTIQKRQSGNRPAGWLGESPAPTTC